MDQTEISKFLLSKISLASLELLIIDVSLKETFISAIGKRDSRRALILKWINSNGTVGYGECSCRPDPFYSHEYVDGAVQVVKDFIFPLLVKANTYNDVLQALSKIRGWHFTKAAVEFAMNDALRKETGRGILEASGIAQIDSVPVGISLGIFASADSLAEKLEEIDENKYRRLKFKISPEYENQEILNYLKTLDHENISFDANGSFNANSFDYLDRVADLGRIIEQPFPPTELYLYQEYLNDHQQFKVCLDEDIESYGNLVSLASEMQEVNIKPGRVGGLYTSLKMIDYCQQNDLDAWIGGMFETGIGRAQNLQLAAMLPNARAHDLSPSSRYFAEDVLQDPIQMEDGKISANLFMQPTVDEDVLRRMNVSRIVLKK
jgi:o-succinylbenzoate synthase